MKDNIKTLRDIIDLAADRTLPGFAAAMARKLLDDMEAESTAAFEDHFQLAFNAMLPQPVKIEYPDHVLVAGGVLHGEQCKVCKAVRRLDSSERSSVEAAISNAEVSHTAIAREFTRCGEPVSRSSVARHRAFIQGARTT